MARDAVDLRELPSDAGATDELVEAGRVLDNFYIPTRYPNSHAEGAPFEHYGPLQSKEALQRAVEISEFIDDKVGSQ